MERLKNLLKSKVFWIIIVLIVAAFGYFKFFNKTAAVTPTYQIGKVQTGTISTSVSNTGQIVVGTQIEVKPRVSGILESLRVKNGQKVKKGDIIAIIDDSDAQKSIRNASLDLENAQISLEKTEKPTDEYTISSARSDLAQAQLDLKKLQDPPTALELETAQNAVTQAERSVQQAEDNVAKTTLNADQSIQLAYNNAHTSLTDVYLNTKDIVKTDASDFIFHLPEYKSIMKNDSIMAEQMGETFEDAVDAYDKAQEEYGLKIQAIDEQSEYIDSLLADTLTMEKTVYKFLSTSLAVYDKVDDLAENDTSVNVSSVKQLKPRLVADMEVISKNISDLQTVKNNFDDAIKNSPIDLNNANASVIATQENLKEKQLSLEKLTEGATDDDIFIAQEKVKQRQQSLNKLLEGPEALDLKSAQLSVQSRKNSLADAQEQLAYYTVRAPFDGTIATVPVVEGDVVSSGTSLATLINAQTMAQISLNEIDAVNVQVGDRAMMTFDSIEDLTISGNVVEIDTVGTVNQGLVSFNAKIALDTTDERIRPGMSVSANVITEVKQNILEVPSSAVKTQNNQSYVEVVENLPADVDASTIDTAGYVTVNSNLQKTQKTVETGISDDSNTEIISGLNEGDLIITKTTTATTATAATTANSSNRSGFSMFGGGGGGGGTPRF
ncbi:efflux RND transporter periplasmic adaptor subunit [Candidatus Peregrinibacteria bacterium]|nr:efflux RND transporter periplasmic adaptor subunit [Candidatus Peregrinibacteria bacterium]